MLDSESEERKLGNDDRTRLTELLTALTGTAVDDVYIDDFGQTHLDFGRLRVVAYSKMNEQADATQIVLTLALRSPNLAVQANSTLALRYYETRGIDYSTECTIIGYLVRIGCYNGNPEPDGEPTTAA